VRPCSSALPELHPISDAADAMVRVEIPERNRELEIPTLAF
jgi:hypothetical protein